MGLSGSATTSIGTVPIRRNTKSPHPASVPSEAQGPVAWMSGRRSGMDGREWTVGNGRCFAVAVMARKRDKAPSGRLACLAGLFPFSRLFVRRGFPV